MEWHQASSAINRPTNHYKSPLNIITITQCNIDGGWWCTSFLFNFYLLRFSYSHSLLSRSTGSEMLSQRLRTSFNKNSVCFFPRNHFLERFFSSFNMFSLPLMTMRKKFIVPFFSPLSTVIPDPRVALPMDGSSKLQYFLI